jgi:transposase
LKQTRKRYGSQDKVKILKRHLLEKVPISAVCEEFGIAPTMLYRWQEKLFQNAAVVFDSGTQNGTHLRQQEVDQLQQKISQKNEVIAELMAEHVALKKEFGEL